MSIRDRIQKARERAFPPKEKTLRLTSAALDMIQRYRSLEENADAVFCVETVPHPIGFTVKVTFDPNESPLRSEFEQPVAVSDEDWERLREFEIDVHEGRFVARANVRVHMAETPNPASRKFMVNRTLIVDGTAIAERSSLSADPPLLISMLFEISQVDSLFFCEDWVSVTVTPDSAWTDDVHRAVGRVLQAWFAHGGAPLDPQTADGLQAEDEVTKKIIGILDEVVRPQVQQDGGDLVFAGFSEGVVSLYMRGSCSGCPSSTATLKHGVERLLKESVPEVREVTATIA